MFLLSEVLYKHILDSIGYGVVQVLCFLIDHSLNVCASSQIHMLPSPASVVQ